MCWESDEDKTESAVSEYVPSNGEDSGIEGDEGSRSPSEAARARREDARLNSKRKLDVTEEPVLEFIKHFTKTFKEMLDERKWKLSTGKVVEDALYEFGLKCTEEHLSHSFVLDPDDTSYVDENIFTIAELKKKVKFISQ